MRCIEIHPVPPRSLPSHTSHTRYPNPWIINYPCVSYGPRKIHNHMFRISGMIGLSWESSEMKALPRGVHIHLTVRRCGIRGIEYQCSWEWRARSGGLGGLDLQDHSEPWRRFLRRQNKILLRSTSRPCSLTSPIYHWWRVHQYLQVPGTSREIHMRAL